MEWHAHRLNGQRVLETGRALLIGPGTKPRNFVAANDVAELAVRALLDPRFAGETIEIGGPGNYTDTEVAQLYARAVGIEPRIAHVPRGFVRTLAPLVAPLHPGAARVMHILSLDDSAFDETFDCERLLARHPMRLTSLPDFVHDQVARARRPPAHRHAGDSTGGQR
jgi:nucleoside-diphosphate-sugar epimerase